MQGSHPLTFRTNNAPRGNNGELPKTDELSSEPKLFRREGVVVAVKSHNVVG